MSRRSILRANPSPTLSADQARRRQRLQSKVQAAQSAIDRWWKRLHRAMNAVQKHQKQLSRLQKQIAQLQGG